MNPVPEARRLGDYQLREKIGETENVNIWLAEQVSISRMVIVDELKPERADRMDVFLADIRAKAAVDHPLVASVYEASAVPGQCFCAHELLPGETLYSRIETRDKLMPGKFANLLRRISESQIQHESQAIATDPLSPEAIHLDAHGVVRIRNLATGGFRKPSQSKNDILTLGQAFPKLVEEGQPGSTRMLTVFSWMRGEGVDTPLTWAQTRDLCLQIEHQLADPLTIIPPGHPSRGGKKPPVTLIAVCTLAVLAGIIYFAFQLRPPVKPLPARVALPEPVTVPAGIYPTPDGENEEIPAFRISANEVTIGQYEEFLSILDVLKRDDRATLFAHADQPAEKTSHVPQDWEAMLAAAKSAGTWNNHTVTLDSPVVGVDWWDATAYAKWKKGSLPTQSEWHAALTHQLDKPGTLPSEDWMPVTEMVADRTPTGLRGMAGSVSEWTAEPAPNPNNPLGEKLWVIVGGSYLKPNSSALTREWTANRSMRRPDLGFRIVVGEE